MTGHILVVEDNPITRKMMRVTLEVAGFTVDDAGTGRDALALAATRPPILILQDLLLPDLNGLDLVRLFRALPETSDVPIIAVSGLLSRLEEARAIRAGFTEYLFKPVEPSRLRETVARVLAPVRGDTLDGSGRRLLLVDDDVVQCKLNRLQLQNLGFAVSTAPDGAAAFESARLTRPDIIVSDLLMPKMNGIELCMAIRNDASLGQIPLILTSSTFTNIDDEDRALAQKVGANAFVVRTPGMREIVTALREALSSTCPPPVAKDAVAAQEEYSRRLMRQLEHQATINASLLQRTAMDAALLSIAGASAEVTAHVTDLEETLRRVLTCALDAGGVSAGAIFLRNTNGGYDLRAVVGRDAAERLPMEDFFGHAALLALCIAREKALTIPSAIVEPDVSHDLLARAHAAGLLIAPLLSRGIAYGALVMMTSDSGMTSEWLTSASTIAAQLAQTVALSKTIDDLTTSEKSLRDKEERFGQLAANVSEVFFVMDSQFRETLFISPAYETVWGKTCQSIYDDPKSFIESVLPEDRNSMSANIAQAQGGERPDPLDFRIVRPDGSVRWISSTAVPILNDAGEVYRISGVARDITERRETRLALEESLKRYQRLAEASFDGVVVSRDNVIVEVNRGFLRMFGYETEDEAVGRNMLDFLAPESREAAMNRVAQGVEGDFEIICVRKDGQKILVELTARSHQIDGRPGRIAALRDVTKRRQLEDQFRQAQKMEAVGRLAGGVAHDFNNLLTVIMGHTEILLGAMGAADPRRADLEQVAKAGTAAASLTRQLLTFSRREVVEPRNLALRDVVSQTRKMLSHVIGEDVEVTTELTSKPCVVRIDQGQLEQVIMNLAVNARDAMPTGGTLLLRTDVVTFDETAALARTLAGPGRYATLVVRDNGSGMDAETRERIFEPFFTTKELGKGTGLGLATVHGIVEQNGGFIDVDSQPGLGTTFTVFLPLANGASDAPVLPIREENPRGNETILLVEDSTLVREVTRRILERQGYVVIEAADPASALIAARRPNQHIDLLLTDVVMPLMSGRILAERFAETHPAAKVIFMSGYTDDAVVRHGVLGAGMPYLQKPFAVNVLACKVRDVLGAATIM